MFSKCNTQHVSEEPGILLIRKKAHFSPNTTPLAPALTKLPEGHLVVLMLLKVEILAR